MFRVEAVLFDFDGTLVALEIDFPLMRRRVNETIAQFGVPPQVVTAPFSWERIEQAAAWLARSDPLKAKVLEREGKAIIVGMEEKAAQVAVPPDDVLPTLLTLRARGIKVGLVTRNSMRAVQTVLRRHPLPFDAIATRDHVRPLKPHPAHLHFALKLLGLTIDAHCMPFASRQAKAAFVGDHPADVQVALRLGLVPVGKAQDDLTENALWRSGAFLVVRKVSELLHWLM